MFLSTTRSPDKPQPVSPVILNVNKKILNRQSIFRKFDTIQGQRDQQLKPIDKVSHKLTEEQIKTSSIYCRLEERMANLLNNSKLHKQSYENMASNLSLKIKNEKDYLHQRKLAIWELKNQLLDLDEELEEEQRNLQGEDYEEMYNNDEQESSDMDFNNEGSQQYTQKSQNISSSNQDAQQSQYSHPTCSINQFLTGQTEHNFSSNFLSTNKSNKPSLKQPSLQEIVKEQIDQLSQNSIQH